MDETDAKRITTVGDNVVDCYPDLGVMYPGGNNVNVAVHARRLGAQAAYLGALGSDAAGRVVRDALVSEGVDLSLVRTVEGPNARATVRILDGNRYFVGGDAGVSRFRLTSHDLEVLGTVDLVHTGECSYLEDQLADVRSVARRLSFDFSERPWEYIRTHAPLVDIAVASLPDSEAGAAADWARSIQALGPSVVAVTLGGAGAVLLHQETAVTAPAGRVTVVDTLGAGDAFIARLLLGLVRAEDPARLVSAATEYASGVCTTYGAFGYETTLPSDLELPGVTPDLSGTTQHHAEAPSASVITPSLAQEH